MSRQAIEALVLAKARDGPVFMRSFQAATPVMRSLVVRGWLEPVAPPGGRLRNCVELTARGRQALAEAQP